MHQDQMDLLNEAVERLHSLKRQVRTLQNELKKHSSVVGPALVNGIAEAEEPATAQRVEAEPEKSQEPAEPRAAEALPPPPSPDTTIPSGEFHLWFHERMRALQRERQSLLQKILSTVTGK
jgi:small-conductance mechanosensitive channel